MEAKLAVVNANGIGFYSIKKYKKHKEGIRFFMLFLWSKSNDKSAIRHRQSKIGSKFDLHNNFIEGIIKVVKIRILHSFVKFLLLD